MAKKLALNVAILVTLTALPALLSAQIETRKVSFPAGQTGTKIKSSIKGRQTIDYAISAQANQEMQVTLNSKSTALYFNVLPPGSQGEAIFIGSNEGNKFSGTLSANGVYKVRVYLISSAARRNESASFELSIAVKGGGSITGDVKVAGTPYHATGKVPVALGTANKGSQMADFGVIRHADGSAELHLEIPGGLQQKIKFQQGKWSCISCKGIKYTKTGDEWTVIINDYERYYIPEAVITGG